MNAALETAQFDTVESALRFAFRQNRENYQASLLNRMAGSPGSEGRGLGGLEGAGMAGIIGRHVQALGFGPSAILRARYGQRETKCECGRDCCKGFKTSEQWKEDVAAVTQFCSAAITISNYRFRHGCVLKFFGGKLAMLGGVKMPLPDLARQCGINTRTAEDHNAKVKQFLGKQEGAALHAISVNLREAGIVGSSDR